MAGSIDRGGRCDVGGGFCIVSTHPHDNHDGVSDLVTKGTDNDNVIRCPPSPSSSSTHSSSSYHTPASSSVSSETGALVVSGCCSESVETSSEFEVSVKEEITSTKVTSDACNKEPVCQTDNTANTPHAGATERKVIQPLLIQLPNTTPVGIDIDMVLPIVSYIQPYSPLRHHIEVGDIIIYINGKSVMDLTHMELCQQLNGRKKTKTSSIDDVNKRELTKLVFLPARYRQLKKETQQRIEQGSDEHQHSQCYPHDKMDVAVNKGLDVEKVNNDTDERKASEELVEETNDNISATCSTEEQQVQPSISSSSSSSRDEEDSKSVTRTEIASLENQSKWQQSIQDDEENRSVNNPKPLSRPCTPPSPSRVLTKDDETNVYYPASTFKHSTCDFSPFTNATKTTLTTANSSSLVEGLVGGL